MNDTSLSATTVVRAVIADDERLMRDQLRARLAEVWPELQIADEAKNGLEAVEMVAQHRPEVVFLDIRMPGLTGVDAARQIAQMALGEDEVLPEIVFITAYDQYAVEAFEQGVADYVLKPAERDRLLVTVSRIQRRLAGRFHALDRVQNLAVDVTDGLQHALAEVAPGIAVAQLDRLARAGRSARGHGGRAARAALQHDFDLHGRIAARIENFAADQGLNRGHRLLLD